MLLTKIFADKSYFDFDKLHSKQNKDAIMHPCSLQKYKSYVTHTYLISVTLPVYLSAA